MKEKKEMREKILSKRNQLSSTAIYNKSKLITLNLLGQNLIRPGDKVLLYMNFKSEVDTHQLVEYVINNGTLVLPRVNQSTKSLDLHVVKNLIDLTLSNYGILEPHNNILIEPKDLDVIITPGVAFDPKKFRLGYGAGYYDLLLSRIKPDTKVVSIAFDCQIVKQVPIEKHDIPVDIIITESRVIY